MKKELLQYYEQELVYLKQTGAAFGAKYPKVARRLLLESGGSEDPHVERLLQGFAFLAARVHLRIDDDFPQLSETMLKIVHPSYLRPVPSMTIVECQPDPLQGKRTAGARIPRGTQLVSKAMVNQLPCRFRTAYDVELWPFTVSQAEWSQPERMRRPARARSGEQAVAAASVQLTCSGDATFAGLELSCLRFHLAGSAGVVYDLYELFGNNCMEIQLRDPADPKRIVYLDRSHVRLVGFDKEEALLPVDRRAIDGYRLLQEYFCFPEKFLFFDLRGLAPLGTGGFGKEVELVFLFSKFENYERQSTLEQAVSASTFRLGCTPAINLFLQKADAIPLSQTKYEYRIVPDGRHTRMMEIYSIEQVVVDNPRLGRKVTLDPMYSFRYQTLQQAGLAFWNATRQPRPLRDAEGQGRAGENQEEDEPSVVTISIVDLDAQITDPDGDYMRVDTLCSNFNLPVDFSFGDAKGDFNAPGFAEAKVIKAIRRPTRSLDPPAGDGQVWRLISLLSLNYLSLTAEGCTGLQEILRLHNLTNDAANQNQIRGIMNLRSRPHFSLIESEFGLVPARGTRVDLELDEQQFAGAGTYLFSAVLDRFLAGYCSMNSFTQLAVRTNKRREEMVLWPPRAGNQALL